MTMLKIKAWNNPHDLADMDGMVTLTRCIDPANNTNKYRRFIVMSAPGERHLLITHTGRWTNMTAIDNWSGGTYRYQKAAAAAQQRRCGTRLDIFLNEEVSRKLGGYSTIPGATDVALSDKQIHDIFRYAALIESTINPTVAPPQKVTPMDAAAPVNHGSLLENQISALLAQANTPGADPFDLFADLAQLKQDVAREYERVESMQQQLAMANEMIVALV